MTAIKRMDMDLDTLYNASNYQGYQGTQAANANYNQAYYNSYPYGNYSYISTVYVDKTEKAFNVAKKLMAEKLVECDTVKEFIALIHLLVSTI